MESQLFGLAGFDGEIAMGNANKCPNGRLPAEVRSSAGTEPEGEIEIVSQNESMSIERGDEWD